MLARFLVLRATTTSPSATAVAATRESKSGIVRRSANRLNKATNRRLSHQWYDLSMAVAEYTKKSVTIPTDLLTSVDQVRRQRSLSAFVSEALRRQVEREGLADLVAELDAVHGPMSPDEAQRQAQALT